MKITNTQKYYNIIRDFRKALRAIDEKFSPRYEELRRYEGSAGYKESVDELDKARKGLIDEVRVEASKELEDVVAAMRTAYQSRPSKAPTQEQLAILQALKMRENVGKDELREALNAVQDCPLAVQVIGEIAAKHHHILGLRQELSRDMVSRSLDALLLNGQKMISRLERPGEARRTAVNTGNWDGFRFDVDPADPQDCARVFGGVGSADFSKFAEMVDN